MSTQASQIAAAPSKKAIAMATVVALVVAGIILAVAVLPAEYGIDPLGTGKALGLTELAKAAAAKPAETPAASTPAKTNEVEARIVPVLEPAKDGEAPVMKGTFIGQRERFKVDSREFKLKAGEGTEIKYNMKKGAGLVYSWTADDKLLFEFHGEPNVKPAGKEGTDYYETYDIDNQVGRPEGHGTFVAPSTGIHGWFWENKTGHEVTVKLVASGFFDWVFQNVNDKHSALKPMEADVIPSHPKVPDEVLK